MTDTVSALAAVGAADRWVTTLTLGVTADYESVPDLDVFASGIGRGLAQLGQAD